MNTAARLEYLGSYGKSASFWREVRSIVRRCCRVFEYEAKAVPFLFEFELEKLPA